MNKKTIIASVVALTLSGCMQRINEVKKDAQDTGIKASSLIQQMGDNYPVVQFKNSQYVNTVPIPKPKAKYTAPPNVANCKVSYLTKTPQDIFQFSQDMTDQCGVRVRVTPDVLTYLGGSSGIAGSVTQRMSSVPSPLLNASTNAADMKPLADFGAEASGGTATAAPRNSGVITGISFTGLRDDLFDLVTGRLGISWKYENGEYVLYYLETRRFDILPADAKYTLQGKVTSGLSNSTGSSGDTGGSSSSGVSGSGGSTMSSEVAMGNNLYADLKATVQSMLTPGAGRLSLNQTTGTLMVTDVPDVINRVAEYLDDENSTLSRQVVLKVVTYTVNSEVSDVVGIDWNLIWKSLNQSYGITLANTSSDIPIDAISGGFNVLDTATGSAAQFAGSKFLLNALSQQVTVSDVKTNTIMTTNMAAAPVLVGQQTTYLQTMTSTPYQNGNSTVMQQSLTPGSYTTGTNVTILPKILKNSESLMLNMFMDISSLKGLRVIGTETEKIEAPEIYTRSIQQRIWLKPGQTVIMSGFEQNIDNSNRKGVGSPDNIIAGGNISGAKTKQSFVITVTPYVR